MADVVLVVTVLVCEDIALVATAGAPKTNPDVGVAVLDVVDEDTAAGVLNAKPSKGFFSSVVAAGVVFFPSMPNEKPSVVDDAVFEPKLKLGAAMPEGFSTPDEDAVDVAGFKLNFTLGVVTAGVKFIAELELLDGSEDLLPKAKPAVAKLPEADASGFLTALLVPSNLKPSVAFEGVKP